MNQPEQKPSTANEMVLVDDDKLTLEIVSWISRKTAFTTHLFADHEEAYQHVCKQTPRLLVVDYYMPGLTGIEFVEQLSETIDLKDTSIFLCSAVAPRGLSEYAMAELNIHTLEKSVICDKLLLTELLEKHLD